MGATSQSTGMNGGTGLNGPSPVMVYMSGRHRGTVEPLTENTVLIAREGHRGVRVGASADNDTEVPVRLHRSGGSYELEVMPEQLVWVNAERTQGRLLESGDVLEIGRNGPMLRYRMYADGVVPERSVARGIRGLFRRCAI